MTNCELKNKFLEIFGQSDEKIRIFQAPGRINLIGEHIDYNGGNVFPLALDMNNKIFARFNGTNKINMAVTSLPNRESLDISDLSQYKDLEWGNYQAGVAYYLKEEGYDLVGCDLLYHGEVPYGAALSSSAAIEVSTAICLAMMAGKTDLVMEDIAVLCQKAENEYVGMNCGIMDQFISAVAKKDHAIFLNCATLDYEYVPLELGDYTIVITNTNAPHKLTDSQYNTRRTQSEQALDIINANDNDYKYLCDIESDRLYDILDYFECEEDVLYRRAKHCITEQQRTVMMAQALKKGDMNQVGRILCKGNISMKDDYECTGKELDTVFDIATSIDGVIGSRMTGGGFGGCNISIVEKDKVENFKKIMSEQYEKAIGIKPAFYSTNAGNGACEVFE